MAAATRDNLPNICGTGRPEHPQEQVRVDGYRKIDRGRKIVSIVGEVLSENFAMLLGSNFRTAARLHVLFFCDDENLEETDARMDQPIFLRTSANTNNSSAHRFEEKDPTTA